MYIFSVPPKNHSARTWRERPEQRDSIHTKTDTFTGVRGLCTPVSVSVCVCVWMRSRTSNAVDSLFLCGTNVGQCGKRNGCGIVTMYDTQEIFNFNDGDDDEMTTVMIFRYYITSIFYDIQDAHKLHKLQRKIFLCRTYSNVVLKRPLLSLWLCREFVTNCDVCKSILWKGRRVGWETGDDNAYLFHRTNRTNWKANKTRREKSFSRSFLMRAFLLSCTPAILTFFIRAKKVKKKQKVNGNGILEMVSRAVSNWK